MKSAYDTLILTLKEGKSFQLNWYFFFGLILPILISFTMVFIREKIVRWVQYGFLIKQNLNEIDIEMYIITKILELRKNN